MSKIKEETKQDLPDGTATLEVGEDGMHRLGKIQSPSEDDLMRKLGTEDGDAARRKLGKLQRDKQIRELFDEVLDKLSSSRLVHIIDTEGKEAFIANGGPTDEQNKEVCGEFNKYMKEINKILGE